MFKKATGFIIITMFIVLSAAGSVLAAGLSDLKGHWAAGQINKWADMSLVAGYGDGTYKPDRQVTRAEFVALVNRAFAVERKSSGVQFSDVKPSSWYYDEVASATAAGYIVGYSDGAFGPENAITRQEAAVILVKLLKLTPYAGGLDKFLDAGHVADWARGNVGAVVRVGLMVGMPDNTFQPKKSITRAEAVVSLDRALGFTFVAVPFEPVRETGIEGKATLNNAAVPNALIKVYEAGGYKVLGVTKTDASGKFTIKLEPGKYDLTATTDKEVSSLSSIQVNLDKVTVINLPMQVAAVVKGTLKDKDNKPVSNTALIFTTNPTFTTSTDNNGDFIIALAPNQNYRVSSTPGGGDPAVIENNLQVGQAGQHNVNIKTETSGSQPVAGGGVLGGAPPANQAPVVNSVAFVVNGKPVTVAGSNNNFHVDFTGDAPDSNFTEIIVNASSDAHTARVSLLGISKTITFSQGVSSVSVSELIGKPGITLDQLRAIMGLLGTNNISVTVTGKTGLTAEVQVIINV